MNTVQWLYRKYKSKKALPKSPVSSGAPLPPPTGVPITKLAIVLDGEVQEVIRAQDRMTALLLSDPDFIELSVDFDNVTIGWKYEDGKFIAPTLPVEIIEEAAKE
jgi:hypothetical protein